jgi:hypothetical protein
MKNADDHVFPNDLQFNSKRFTSLFLKPTCNINIGIVSKIKSFNDENDLTDDVYQVDSGYFFLIFSKC